MRRGCFSCKFPGNRIQQLQRAPGSSRNSRFLHALSLYTLIHRSGNRPDPHAISAALKACATLPSKPSAAAQKLGHTPNSTPSTPSTRSSTKSLSKAHSHTIPSSPLLPLPTSHLRSGSVEATHKLFDKMSVRDIVSLNTMLSRYIREANMHSVRKLFDQMPLKSNVPWLTMISGCVRCSEVDWAWELFKRMDDTHERNVFCWNAMIACFAQNWRHKEAIRLFNKDASGDSFAIPLCHNAAKIVLPHPHNENSHSIPAIPVTPNSDLVRSPLTAAQDAITRLKPDNPLSKLSTSIPGLFALFHTPEKPVGQSPSTNPEDNDDTSNKLLPCSGIVTPRLYWGKASSTSSFPSDCSSMQNMPTKSVTKSYSRPPLGLGPRTACFSTEIPHFELREDPDFWLDHSVQIVLHVRLASLPKYRISS